MGENAAAASAAADMTWMAVEAEDCLQQPRAVRRVETGGENVAELKMRLNMLKLLAQQAQTARLLLAATFWTCLLPRKVTADAQKAAKTHGDRTRGQSCHKLGPPHPHIWRALLHSVRGMVQELIDQDKANQHYAPLVLVLSDYIKAYEQKPAEYPSFIKMCKIKDVKEEKAVLNWTLSPLLENRIPMDRAFSACLVALGGDIRHGTPPADPMERQLQRDIDDITARIAAATTR